MSIVSKFNKKMISFGVILLFIQSAAFAEKSIRLQAEVDREEIAEDESVSLQVSIESNTDIEGEAIGYSAPDFEVINTYTSTQVSQTYDGSGLNTVVTKQYTYVLRPKKQGRLKVSNINVKIDGKMTSAPDKTINVQAGGAVTQPPKNYGGAGSGLRGAVKEARTSSVFLRTEVNKDKIYKGESVVVSYYFYARSNGFTVVGEKYPEMSGFLKEEVDMPILTGRLESQVITLDGIAYKKVLLARYNASPLKSGHLKIDPLMVKAQYYNQNRGAGSEDEADDIFSQFFNRLTPQVAQLKGDLVTLEVLDTPSAPEDSIGAIGEFNVSANVDRSTMNVNDPFTITLKIEGRGNFSQIKVPELNLSTPENKNLQLFESKNKIQGGKAGTQGEKTFEYLIVPRQPGTYILPGFKFSVFNTKTGKYEEKNTTPFSIQVSGTGDSNSSTVNQNEIHSDSSINENTNAVNIQDKVKTSSLALLENVNLKRKNVSKNGLIFFLISSFFLFMGLIFFIFKKIKNKKEFDPTMKLTEQKFALEKKIKQIDWSKLETKELQKISLSFSEYFMDWFSVHYGENVRSMARTELKSQVILSNKFNEESWTELEGVVNSLETIQFSGEIKVRSLEEQALFNHSIKQKCEKLLTLLT